MKINANTRISELIEADASVIEVLASVSKPFKRLRNPILRKIMAPRATIAEAAKMGGCTVEAVILALRPLGFEYERLVTKREEVVPVPQWLSAAPEESVTSFDVRGIIESGTDPLREIISAFKHVPPGGVLCIVNSFVPTPLIHLLKQDKAEDSYVRKISDKEFHTYFLKKRDAGTSHEDIDLAEKENGKGSFDELLSRFSPEKIKEIDVRDLEMPLPMQTILEALKNLPMDNVLFVHHKRIPVYLLEALSGKGYETHVQTIDEHNVKMVLFRQS